MSVKISELPSASSVTSSDVVPIVQNGETKQANLGIVASAGGVPTGSILQYDGNTIPAGYEEVNGFDNYSTTEQRIGTWIDGKPLYQKVITVTTTSGTNTEISKNDISPNMDTLTRFFGTTLQPSGNISLIPYYASSDDRTSIYYSSSLGKLRIGTGSNYGFGIANIVVEYTKTTD